MTSVASTTTPVSTVQEQAPPYREFYGRCEQVKTSPQKLNLVAKVIRRMKVVDALVQLEYSDKKVATFIKDTIKETQRNAIQIHKANPDNLYVSASYVGKGTYLKRIRYHGKGQSGKMYKYYSHYFLKLREGPPPVKKKKSKRCDLATALALSHVFLMIILLMNHFIHLIGIISYYCYSQLHYTTGTAVKQVLYSLMLLHFAVYSTNMTSSSFYLIIFLLLLLSGDIELNPGPGNPREVLQIHSYDLTRTVASNCYELTSALYAKDLIPHGTKEEIITTTALSNDQRAARLVLAIEGRLESSLDQQQYLINICGVLRNQRDRQLKDIAKSILHQLGQSTVTPMGTSHASLSSSMEHTSTIAKCWQWFCKMMCRNNNNEQPRQEQGIIELQQTNLTVSQPTLGQSVQSLVHDYTDTPSFVDSDIEESVQSLVHDDTDTPSIADSLHHDSHLVEPVPNDVLEYAEIMRQKYNAELIVATDWPPRVGKDFFGRLALVEKDRFVSQVETAWYLLRGQIDRIPRLHGNREITVKNILAPSKNKDSLRVVIDGPPGIGKTTLCRKLLNMWSNGSLVHQHYDLVLYCPLRNAKIAEAKTIADLFIYRSSAHAMSSIAEWFENNHGKGLLIFFDGWDELSEQFRQSSLATSIIHREMLFHCSVIVTSRSYASSSLLEMSSLSKHIQVCGFSEKQIANVIRETLEDSVDSHLAMKLINDLEIRGDVKSLCYVPLVCSMVILVYRKEGGHLPTTLTQLYENFILQTIRRHVKRHDINPRTLGSLSSLPPELAKHFLELCRIAYTNLASTQMTFSSHQLQSLSEEDYLGLMTTFMEYDEEKYQFLHLSIQEFLAAWWIAKHEEKTEEVFKDHFDNDHFRMCLRFVAGLTHLEHESYQQYFNAKQLGLQYMEEASTEFENCSHSEFYLNPAIKPVLYDIYDDLLFYTYLSICFDEFPILLIQLIYESQNTKLCQVLAQSIANQSFCLDRATLSLFDWLCLSYFIDNSNTKWNHLDLGALNEQKMNTFTSGLTNGSLTSNLLECILYMNGVDDGIALAKKISFFCIKECYFYCHIEAHYNTYLILLQLFKFSQLKILHFHLISNSPEFAVANKPIDASMELENCIEKNTTVQEMRIKTNHDAFLDTVTAVIKGVTKNKTITSFRVHLYSTNIPEGIFEQLLIKNTTIKALSLNVGSSSLLHTQDSDTPSLKIKEINMPLKALEIRGFTTSQPLLPQGDGLHCLIHVQPYSHPLQLIFSSHPNLCVLEVSLDTEESVCELLTILQNNTTLKALKVNITILTTNVYINVQNMLRLNQTLSYFEIFGQNEHSYYTLYYFPPSYIKYNTSLQSVHISISTTEEVKSAFDAISHMKYLTEINFELDSQVNGTHFILAVMGMLQSSTTIRQLRIKCTKDNDFLLSIDHWRETTQHFYETVFTHPSIEYIQIVAKDEKEILNDFLEEHKRLLLSKHEQEQPYRQLPIVIHSYS
uniref:NACHT domain-containing protein n=1 Tax=Amphimedon queenslandica TaxID=400682 RepID=A0A1X7TZE5_AMPQE